MTFVLRNLLPFTYFQYSRLNKWKYVIYHSLLEWIPSVLLVLFYNNYEYKFLITLLLNYLAFISIHEIGYLTNDFFSEKFEKSPRGRMSSIKTGSASIYFLIFVRVIFFVLITYLLNAQANIFWWLFFASMLATFIFHNLRAKRFRTSSFFCLSVFRFIAPLVLTLPVDILKVLFCSIMLCYSFFRTLTYIEDRAELTKIPSEEEVSFKVNYFLNCMPLSFVLTFLFDSFVPVIFCLYYMVIWVAYSKFSKFRQS